MDNDVKLWAGDSTTPLRVLTGHADRVNKVSCILGLEANSVSHMVSIGRVPSLHVSLGVNQPRQDVDLVGP